MQVLVSHSLKRFVLVTSCLFLCVLTACSTQQAQTIDPPRATTPASGNYDALLGKNLIVNGDAESGQGVPDDGHLAQTIPGWQRQGTFNVVQYDASGGFPTAKDPGPAQRGKNFFAGGPDTDANGNGVDNTRTSATQSIDISAMASLIDTETVTYTLSGYFGGFSDQRDNVQLTVEFVGGVGQNTVTINGPTVDERQSNTSLLERHSSGKLPKGTRTIKLTLTVNKLDGGYNDGYADNLSLILSH